MCKQSTLKAQLRPILLGKFCFRKMIISAPKFGAAQSFIDCLLAVYLITITKKFYVIKTFDSFSIKCQDDDWSWFNHHDSLAKIYKTGFWTPSQQLRCQLAFVMFWFSHVTVVTTLIWDICVCMLARRMWRMLMCVTGKFYDKSTQTQFVSSCHICDVSPPHWSASLQNV